MAQMPGPSSSELDPYRMDPRRKMLLGIHAGSNPLFNVSTNYLAPLKSWAYDKADEDERAAEMRERFEKRGGLDFIGDAFDKTLSGVGKAAGYAAPIAAAYFGGPIGGAAWGALQGGQKGGWQGAALGGAAGYAAGKGFSRFPGSYGYQSPASYIDPFTYGPAAGGGAVTPTMAGAGGGYTVPIDDGAPGVIGGIPGMAYPAAGAAGAAGGVGGAAATPWWKSALIKGGVGLGTSMLLGGETGAERDAREAANMDYGDAQKYLPPALRDLDLDDAISQLLELLQNPGALGSGVSEAIKPRLAAESESIAQNYRGIASNQAGAAARGNLPVSIKGALASALDVAQERAQRGARRDAMMDSEALRRQDIEQVYALLQTILGFMNSGRGISTAGLSAAANASAQRRASQMALIGSLLSGV